MDLVVAASSFSLIFVAEMGDKSQLIAMTLACRYRAAPVIVGVFAAFLLLNLLAVLVGAAVTDLVPRWVVLTGAGLLFVVFGVRTWRDADAAEDAGATRTIRGGVMVTSFVMILLAELGDKTQLAMIGLAAGTGAPWSVLVGGTLALWAVSLIGILVGSRLLTRLPAGLLHRAAAVLFIGFGLVALAGVVGPLFGPAPDTAIAGQAR